jgi:hypothetical protein
VILANYTQENRNCTRVWGMAFTNPQGQFRPPLFLNEYTPDTALTGLDQSGLPHGYNTEASWALPIKTGGLGATYNLRGSGTLSASALAVKLAQAALTGTGELTALGSLIVQAIASITGSGGITAANLQAFLAAAANLTGSGTAAGTATGLGALLAALTASGTAAGSTATALGELGAALTVTGTGLSTANVGQAVWAEILESGFSAADIMRIIAAYAAGAATGLEGANPQFTGIDGVTTRIDGTYAAGTRTINNLDGE